LQPESKENGPQKLPTDQVIEIDKDDLLEKEIIEIDENDLIYDDL
jgi:hypothetical protein